MAGDNRTRFCSHCQLNVYNIAELSHREAESLIAGTEGRICARLFRRTDGTILTRDCPVGLRALRRRVSRAGAAIFATLAGLCSVVVGQTPKAKKEASCPSQTRVTIKHDKSANHSPVFSGTLFDPNGAVISGASLVITNDETKTTLSTTSDSDGKFEFAALPEGKHLLRIVAPGFKAYEWHALAIQRNKIMNVNITMLLAENTVVVGILDGGFQLIDNSPGLKTVISGDLIRKLPL